MPSPSEADDPLLRQAVLVHVVPLRKTVALALEKACSMDHLLARLKMQTKYGEPPAVLLLHNGKRMVREVRPGDRLVLVSGGRQLAGGSSSKRTTNTDEHYTRPTDDSPIIINTSNTPRNT